MKSKVHSVDLCSILNSFPQFFLPMDKLCCQCLLYPLLDTVCAGTSPGMVPVYTFRLLLLLDMVSFPGWSFKSHETLNKLLLSQFHTKCREPSGTISQPLPAAAELGGVMEGMWAEVCEPHPGVLSGIACSLSVCGVNDNYGCCF